MIPILKGAIAYNNDNKILGEDGEDAATDWGTKPSPKAKPLGDDPEDTPTHGWGNSPNPKKDLAGIEV